MGAQPAIVNSAYENTRRWRRFKINVPIRAVVRCTDHRVLIVEGRGNELNEGGMQVFAGVELKLGDTLEVEFTPPYHGMPVRARCIVRNRRGYYYGVEFLRGNVEDEQKIATIRATLEAMGSPIQ